MYIPIILGTARQGRQSEKVTKFILEEVKKVDLETEILDVRDFRIEATDNSEKSPQAQKLAEKIDQADGLIIVSPEYNHSYPGELKMMLDMLYSQYEKKPLGICGVSSGSFGGARMIKQLIPIVVELGMTPIRQTMYFPKVQNLFDEEGKIKDKDYYAKAKNFLDELIWYAKALKTARERNN